MKWYSPEWQRRKPKGNKRIRNKRIKSQVAWNGAGDFLPAFCVMFLWPLVYRKMQINDWRKMRIIKICKYNVKIWNRKYNGSLLRIKTGIWWQCTLLLCRADIGTVYNGCKSKSECGRRNAGKTCIWWKTIFVWYGKYKKGNGYPASELTLR